MLSRRKKRAAVAGILTSSILAAVGLSAAEYLWVGPSGGNWSDSSKWLGNSAPPSGGGVLTELRFTGAGGNTTAFNDLGSPFLANRLSLDYAGSGIFTVSAGTLQFA